MPSYRLVFIYSQIVFCLFLFTVKDVVPLFLIGVVSGIWVIISYGAMVLFELNSTKDFPPITLYIAHQVITLGMGILYVIVLVVNDYPLKITSLFVSPDFLPDGILMAIGGDTLLLSGYFYAINKFDKKRIETLDWRKIGKYKFSHLTWFYIITLIIRPITPFLKTIGKFFELLLAYGGLIVLILTIPWMMSENIKDRRKAYVFGMLVTVGELIYYNATTSKERILIYLVPWLILFLLKNKKSIFKLLSPKVVVSIILLLYFVVFVFFPFFQLRRSLYFRGGEIGGARELDNLSLVINGAVPFSDEFYQVHQLPNKGFWSFFSRNSKIIETTLSVESFVGNRGSTLSFLAEDFFIAVIPRIIWPGKPKIITGARVTDWLLGGDGYSGDRMTSHTGLGLWGGLLLLAGWPGFFLGAIVNGTVMALIWGRIRGYVYNNFIATYIYYILLIGAIKLYSSYDGNFSYFMYIIIVLMPLFYWYENIRKKGKYC